MTINKDVMQEVWHSEPQVFLVQAVKGARRSGVMLATGNCWRGTIVSIAWSHTQFWGTK